MIERRLIFVIVISGVLSTLFAVIHSCCMDREFSSPANLVMSQSLGGGYVGSTTLEKGIRYGIVVGAVMHRSKEMDFKTVLRANINNNVVSIIRPDPIVGNNTLFESEWVSQTDQILYKKLYLGDFVSPETCNKCKIEIYGHSQSYLTEYALETHKNINHLYYIFGYALALCSIVFVLALIAALPYIAFKYVHNVYMS